MDKFFKLMPKNIRSISIAITQNNESTLNPSNILKASSLCSLGAAKA